MQRDTCIILSALLESDDDMEDYKDVYELSGSMGLAKQFVQKFTDEQPPDFMFNKQPWSVKVGDFTVTIGVKGSRNLNQWVISAAVQSQDPFHDGGLYKKSGWVGSLTVNSMLKVANKVFGMMLPEQERRSAVSKFYDDLETGRLSTSGGSNYDRVMDAVRTGKISSTYQGHPLSYIDMTVDDVNFWRGLFS